MSTQGCIWASFTVVWCQTWLCQAYADDSRVQCTSLLQVDTRPGRKAALHETVHPNSTAAFAELWSNASDPSPKGLPKVETSHAEADITLQASSSAHASISEVIPQADRSSLSQVLAAKAWASRLATQLTQVAAHLFQKRLEGGMEPFTIVALSMVLLLSLLMVIFIYLHHCYGHHAAPERHDAAPSPNPNKQVQYTKQDRQRASPPASTRSSPKAPPVSNVRPPDSAARQQDPRILCKELLVPEKTECVLAVPYLGLETSSARNSSRSYAVTDKKGKTLLSVTLELPSGPAGHMLERLTLQPAAGQDALASCDILIPAAVARSNVEPKPKIRCTIMTKAGDLFGRIEFESLKTGGDPNSQCFEMVGVGGTWRLSFYGNLVDHTLNVTNDKSQLLGTVETAQLPFGEPGSYYQLRVAPLADAGLILIALLALDRMHAAGYRNTN